MLWIKNSTLNKVIEKHLFYSQDILRYPWMHLVFGLLSCKMCLLYCWNDIFLFIVFPKTYTVNNFLLILLISLIWNHLQSFIFTNTFSYVQMTHKTNQLPLNNFLTSAFWVTYHYLLRNVFFISVITQEFSSQKYE